MTCVYFIVTGQPCMKPLAISLATNHFVPPEPTVADISADVGFAAFEARSLAAAPLIADQVVLQQSLRIPLAAFVEAEKARAEAVAGL